VQFQNSFTTAAEVATETVALPVIAAAAISRTVNSAMAAVVTAAAGKAF
jgi:hypothetical protein